MANKADRPNIHYRVMVLRLPKSVGSTTTTSSNVDAFQVSQLGSNGNRLCLPIDTDHGIKTYYDRIITNEKDISQRNGGDTLCECHKMLKIHLRRKQSREVVYDSGAQNIVNRPLALYVIPYDARGALVTDNIASYVYSIRMRYKDS
jgi:hypothetical protein